MFGAIAQLGERLHGMQEVVGSNPIGSIFHNLLWHKGLWEIISGLSMRANAMPDLWLLMRKHFGVQVLACNNFLHH